MARLWHDQGKVTGARTAGSRPGQCSGPSKAKVIQTTHQSNSRREFLNLATAATSTLAISLPALLHPLL
jgi:hypothetical protein